MTLSYPLLAALRSNLDCMLCRYISILTKYYGANDVKPSLFNKEM